MISFKDFISESEDGNSHMGDDAMNKKAGMMVKEFIDRLKAAGKDVRHILQTTVDGINGRIKSEYGYVGDMNELYDAVGPDADILIDACGKLNLDGNDGFTFTYCLKDALNAAIKHI